MTAHERIVKTEFADICVEISSGEGFPLVLLHGNSSSKQVFRAQMTGPIGQKHRLIAIDLPGHGQSSDARAPETTYSMKGYAEVVMQVFAGLELDKAALFGWSLGGHVGIELLGRFAGLSGLMISGCPPVNPTVESLAAGFQPNPLMALLGKEHLTPDEVETLLTAIYDGQVDAERRAAMLRTDGRARRFVFETIFTGGASAQRDLVERSAVPIAIVDGAAEPFANLNYIAGLSIPSLWEKHAFILRDAGHAAFLEQPERFDAILGRFVDDTAERKPASAADRSGFAAA